MKATKLTQWGSMMFLMTLLSLSSCKKPIEEENFAPQKAFGGRKSTQGFVENDMVMYWNEKTSMVLTGPGTPPSKSRYFAMIQIAVHDALNNIKPKFETFALKNSREKNANADAAVASAAYWAIIGMGVQGSHPVEDWYNESLASIPAGQSKDLGIALGKKSADAIIAKRLSDNLAIANQQLPSPDGVAPGEYRSTLPFSNIGFPKIKALQQWGTKMTPFVIESNSQFRPVAPDALNSQEYLNDYNEVKTKGARVGHNRTAEEDEIGRFWAEISSFGWNRFARNMIASKKLDSWKTARLFALMHTAMVDDITACFEAKYYYFYWRPETAIRMGDNDGNANTSGDVNWLPSYVEVPNGNNPLLNVYTPPVPEYPSAHASFGGAASEILKLFFNTDNISIHQTSTSAQGITRHYATISQAAKDNSLSRIYIGFHFRNAVVKGEKMGQDVAHYVFNNSFRENGDESN